MLFEILGMGIGLAVIGLMFFAVGRYMKKPMQGISSSIDERELEAAERALKEEGEQDWVILKRCHGPAFNHAAMTQIISALNEGGVTATYDVIASSSMEGGVTNYMLKVLRGEEEKGLEILARL